MFGIDIEDSPENPVGTPDLRRTIAIHWNWTTQYTNTEIADALGVRPETVSRYLSDGPTEGVKQQMENVEAEVRMVAVAELKQQLKEAGHEARTAEQPIKVWPEDGTLNVVDVTDDDTGQVVDRYPLPESYEIGADQQARFYRREEVRDILEQLTDLTGAAEPEQTEVEHSGSVGMGLSEEDKAALGKALDGEPET